MSQVLLGRTSAGQKVVAFDNNDDGVYQQGERVNIIGPKDQLITDTRAVASALKELGIGPLQHGVRLNPLAEYVSMRRVAMEAAKAGDVVVMESAIITARNYAKEAGISDKNGGFSSIAGQIGYPKGIAKALTNAEKAARAGDATFTRTHIELARHYAEKAGTHVDEEGIKAIEDLLKASTLPSNELDKFTPPVIK